MEFSRLKLIENISNAISHFVQIVWLFTHTDYLTILTEGGIGVCGIAVLANFSCGISVILILNCGIAVFSKPAGCVFLAFWSTIVGIKTQP